MILDLAERKPHLLFKTDEQDHSKEEKTLGEKK